MEADKIIGPPTIMFAVLESDDSAVDWVVPVGLTVVTSAASLLAVRESSGVCVAISWAKGARRVNRSV